MNLGTDNILKLILKAKFSYKIGSFLAKFINSDFMKNAVQYQLSEVSAAFNNSKRPTIWCSTFIPSEVVYALNGVPFMPEVAAGFASTIGQANNAIIKSEVEWFNSDICSIHRCGNGLMEKGLLPKPDIILAASHLCDGAKKYLQYISNKYDCPFFLLETPYSLEDRDYLARQIKSLMMKLNTGKVEFGKTFQYSNYARKYLNKINKLRQKSPAVISGEKMLNLIPMSFMSFGSKKGYKFYKMLFKEIKRRKKKNKGIITNEKYRLLWLHLKPYYKNNIFSTLNKMGAVTAFEEYNQVYWKPLDPKSPYESLAEKMINHFGWGKSKKQFEKLVAIINDYNIDGVIAFSQWGCRQNNGKMGLFKKLFKKYNIPFLNIEGDLVDSRNYREGQLKVRLQAFLELLENQGVKGRA